PFRDLSFGTAFAGFKHEGDGPFFMNSLDLTDCTRLEGQVNRATCVPCLELPAAYEPHDPQTVAGFDAGRRPIRLAHDGKIAFHRHTGRIDLQPNHQTVERKIPRNASPLSVYHNFNRLCFSTFHAERLTPRFDDH